MQKINLYTILLGTISLILSSCRASYSYSINGTTDGSVADGQKYFLSAFGDKKMNEIDSCDVIHGQFSFSNSTDTVKLGLIISDDLILPVVLEEGNITITLDSKVGTEVVGTPYNDALNDFRKQLEKIEGEMNDLSEKQMQGIKNGEDEDSLNIALTQEARIILDKKEKLIKKFIVDNFGTPLAAAAFQGLTIVPFMLQNGYAELSPWIDEILTKADDAFKNDPYVKFYIEQAKRVEGIMNGTIELPGQQGQQPQQEQQLPEQSAQQQEQVNQQAPQQEPANDDEERLKELEGTIPTPNQLAEPSKNKEEK